jgi:hypothetical protein
VKEKERKKELRKKCGLTQQEEEKRKKTKNKKSITSVRLWQKGWLGG